MDGQGHIVAAEQAEPGEYRCPVPSCAARLVLKNGPIRVKHFSHLGGSGCAQETIEHWAAKHLLVATVERWVSGNGPRPVLDLGCQKCGGKHAVDLPDKVRGAAIEVRVGSVIPDVVLLDGAGLPCAAVEVYATHMVKVAKAEKMTLKWIELKAEAVLADAVNWHARQHGMSVRCDATAKAAANTHPQGFTEFFVSHESRGGGGANFMWKMNLQHAINSVAAYLSRRIQIRFVRKWEVVFCNIEWTGGKWRGVWKDGQWLRGAIVEETPGTSMNASSR